MRQVLPHIRDWDIDTLLILSGDHLYRMDYREFLARHTDTEADVTVSVVPCGPQAAREFGLLKTDEQGRIVEFKELLRERGANPAGRGAWDTTRWSQGFLEHEGR